MGLSALGANDGLFRSQSLQFHKVRWIYWVIEETFTDEAGLLSVE